MNASRKRGSASPARSGASGLILNKPSDFFKGVCAGLQKGLNLRHARMEGHQVGTREVRYVCEANPVHVLVGEGKPLLAIPLHSTSLQSAWMVVEIEYEVGQPALLQQVSLKVLQGQTTDTAMLCFRAEWDMRDPGSKHAQPHWNVHMPRLTTPSGAPERVETFSEFADRQAPSTFATFVSEENSPVDQSESPLVDEPSSTPAQGFTPEQMHRFHFAMAVDWHGVSKVHSPPSPNPDQMVHWISECAVYVRGQLAFMA